VRVLSVLFVLLAALAPALAQEAGTPPQCEVRGHLSIAAVHVRRVGAAPAVRDIEDRDVRVTPLGHGWFQVRTHGAGARIEGRTESPVPIALAADTTFAGIATVARGTRVDDIEPRADAFVGALAVDDGASLEDVVLTCRDVVATEPTDSALDTVTSPHGPAWRARVSRLRIRAASGDETRPLVVALTPEARRRIAWIEQERNASWARVEARVAHARLTGWVRDTDLMIP
jgi:hypothetical protein